MELTEAEKNLVAEIRALKAKGHSALTIEVKHGKIVKFWTTDKKDVTKFN